MSELRYSFRTSGWVPERTFWISDRALHWRSGKVDHSLAYRDVRRIVFFRQLAHGDAVVRGRIVDTLKIYDAAGRHVTLSPLHRSGFRTWTDRSASYRPFIEALMPRLRNNPQVKVLVREEWPLRLRNTVTHALPPLLGRLGSGLLKAIHCLGLERASRLGAGIMRTAGPFLPATRVARSNLRAAFPDKSAAEIERLIRGVWENFGRVAAECAFIEDFYDYDPANERLITLDPTTVQRATEISSKATPALFFLAHLGSWELSPLPSAFGIPVAATFRPFKSEAMNDLIVRLRTRIRLIPARFGAAAEIEDSLRQGFSFGMLVDQHFTGGVDVTFFGRRCKANPMLARLARKYEFPIYGVRAIHIDRSRYRGELTAPLDPPRDGEGKIDIAGTMQMITDVLEGWIREHPEQWLWLHRRWR